MKTINRGRLTSGGCLGVRLPLSACCLILLCLFVSGGMAHAQTPPSVQELQSRVDEDPDNVALLHILARALIQSGDSDAALEHLRRAVVLDPDHPQVQRDYGMLLLRLGQPEEAREPLRRAVALNGEDARALREYATALLMTGDHGEAVPLLERSLAIEPKDSVTWYNLACAQLGQDHFDQALEALGRVQAIRPVSASVLLFDPDLAGLWGREAFTDLVWATSLEDGKEERRPIILRLLHEGRAPEAQALLNRVPRERRTAEHWFLLGQTEEVLQEPARAALAYQAGCARQKQPDTVRRLLALFEGAEEVLPRIRLLEDYLEVSARTPEFLNLLADLYKSSLNFRAAIGLYRESLELNPAQPGVHAALIDSLQFVGADDEADAEIQKAAAAYPDSPVFLYWQGRQALKAGDVEEAANLLGRATREKDHSHWQMYYGQALSASGELEAAVDALEKAVELQPDLNGAWYQLGQVYRRLGNGKKAREALTIHQLLRGDSLAHLDTVPRDSPALPYIHAEIGRHFLSEDNDPEKAVEHLRQSLELHPDQPGVRYQLGKALRLAGQYEGALEVLLPFDRNIGASADYQQMLAEIYAQIGQTDQADARRALAARLRGD